MTGLPHCGKMLVSWSGAWRPTLSSRPENTPKSLLHVPDLKCFPAVHRLHLFHFVPTFLLIKSQVTVESLDRHNASPCSQWRSTGRNPSLSWRWMPPRLWVSAPWGNPFAHRLEWYDLLSRIGVCTQQGANRDIYDMYKYCIIGVLLYHKYVLSRINMTYLWYSN